MQEFLDAAVNREVHEETLLIVERNQRKYGVKYYIIYNIYPL